MMVNMIWQPFSRRDKGGIVIAYEKKQPGFENNGDITMESLITDFYI